MEAALIIGWAVACSAVVAWCSARLAGTTSHSSRIEKEEEDNA